MPDNHQDPPESLTQQMISHFSKKPTSEEIWVHVRDREGLPVYTITLDQGEKLHYRIHAFLASETNVVKYVVKDSTQLNHMFADTFNQLQCTKSICDSYNEMVKEGKPLQELTSCFNDLYRSKNDLQAIGVRIVQEKAVLCNKSRLEYITAGGIWGFVFLMFLLSFYSYVFPLDSALDSGWQQLVKFIATVAPFVLIGNTLGKRQEKFSSRISFVTNLEESVRSTMMLLKRLTDVQNPFDYNDPKIALHMTQLSEKLDLGMSNVSIARVDLAENDESTWV